MKEEMISRIFVAALIKCADCMVSCGVEFEDAKDYAIGTADAMTIDDFINLMFNKDEKAITVPGRYLLEAIELCD